MKLKYVIVALSLSLFSLCSFASDESNYNQIVIFGDSLSDNGNLYNATFGYIPKSPPYYKGRFSNGPTWSDFVAEYFTNKNKTITANYAYGGETVISTGFINFTNSLNSYYLHTAYQDRSHSLFVIWLGANDYLKSTDPEATTNNVMTVMKKNIESLIKSGGKYFLILNLPDLSAAPLSTPADKQMLHDITLLHNTKLHLLFEKLQQENASVIFRFFDIFAIYEDMTKNLDEYNQKYQTHIKDIKTACWDGGYLNTNKPATENEILNALEKESQDKSLNPHNLDLKTLAHQIAITPSLREAFNVGQTYANNPTLCSNPDDYAFWDHVHPTAPIHSILGKVLIDEINQF